MSRPKSERAENMVEVPLGTVLSDVKGNQWVFCGWPIDNGGKIMYFVQSTSGKRLSPAFSYAYDAAFYDTLLVKFPTLKDYLK